METFSIFQSLLKHALRSWTYVVKGRTCQPGVVEGLDIARYDIHLSLSSIRACVGTRTQFLSGMVRFKVSGFSHRRARCLDEYARSSRRLPPVFPDHHQISWTYVNMTCLSLWPFLFLVQQNANFHLDSSTCKLAFTFIRKRRALSRHKGKFGR